MPLLEKGQPVADPYVTVPDGEPLPPTGPVIVSLERWRAEKAELLARGDRLGVKLKSNQLAPELADDLPSLALVAVEMPKFRDGRAFSTARELRERYGFKGEVRATGHIIPDQYLFLTRVGVDTVEVPADRVGPAWEHALTEISVAYQPARDDAQPLSLLRRHVGKRA